MPGFVKRRDHALFVNTSDDAIEWILARGINDGELLAKVAKDRTEEAKGVGNDEVDALLVAIVADDLLEEEWSVCKNDDLEFIEL
jgi:hypothetical protein